MKHEVVQPFLFWLRNLVCVMRDRRDSTVKVVAISLFEMDGEITISILKALLVFRRGVPLSDSDISLAIRIDDVSLLELAFQANEAVAGDSTVSMSIENPQCDFDIDRESKRQLLRSVVTVRFELVNNGRPADQAPAVVFGTTIGVIASVPVMGDAVVVARHMAGKDDARSRRDNKMAHALRLEAIKEAHGFASAKLVGLSSESATPKLILPSIDADALLRDIEKQEIDS